MGHGHVFMNIPISLSKPSPNPRETATHHFPVDHKGLMSLVRQDPHIACTYMTLTWPTFWIVNNSKTTTRRPKVPCTHEISTILPIRCKNQIEKMLIREGTRPLQSGQKMTPFWAKIDLVLFGNIFRKNLAPKPLARIARKLRGIFFDSCSTTYRKIIKSLRANFEKKNRQVKKARKRKKTSKIGILRRLYLSTQTE